MESSYYKLEIHETAKDSPNSNESPELLNVEIRYFSDLEKIRNHLFAKYGKIPGGKNKVYRNFSREPNEIGFLHSFWNKDISHNSKNWYQTDWICIFLMYEEPIDLNEILNVNNYKLEEE